MFRRIVWGLCALSSLVVATRVAHAEGEFVMKLATVAPEGTPWSEALEKFKKQMWETSGKRLKVKIFYGGTLGDEQETVLQTKRGQIQAVGASTGAVAKEVSQLNMLELPYLFNSEKEADKVIDNILQKPMEAYFRKAGLVLGFWSENGYRSFGTKDKFVKVPKDLKGKKMRAQPSPVHIAMYKAFGASPIDIPTTEVFQSVKTGVVDGFDQTPLYAAAASWHKTIKYFTVTNHIYQPAVITFNAAWFDKLPKDLQDLLLNARVDFQKSSRSKVRKLNKSIIKNLESEGVLVYTLTPPERAVFAALAKKVRTDWKASAGSEVGALLTKVEESLGRK